MPIKTNLRATVLLFGAALMLVACAQSRPIADTARASAGVFSEQVLPLLQQKFAPLLARETGLRLDSWERDRKSVV